MPLAAVRKTLLMLLALAVLVGLALLTEGPWLKGNKRAGGQTIYTGAGKDAVSRFEVSGPRGKTILKKERGSWLVGEGEKFQAADPEVVDKTLDQLADLNNGTVASRSPDKHADLSVDEKSGLLVAVFEGEKKTAEFLVGGQGPDFFSNYVRPKGRDEVLLVTGYLRPMFDKPLRNWRDLKLLSVTAGEVVGLELTGPDGQLGLKKEEKGWRVVLPQAAEAAGQAVEDLLARLAPLKAVDSVEVSPQEAGFDRPSFSLTVTLKDGSSRGLILGKMIGEKNQYYARVAGNETVYLLSAHALGDLTTIFRDLGGG